MTLSNMNIKDIQQQSMEEFDEKELFRLASLVGTDAKNPEEKLIQFIDSLIEKTVQMTEERILQDLEDVVKHTDNIEMKSFLYVDQIKSLITNKSNIIK